jgi:hypothetical protein
MKESELDHSHRVLAEGRVGRVELCAHGTAHLTLGALTLRLTQEQLGELSQTLESAIARLRSAAAFAPPTWSRLC